MSAPVAPTPTPAPQAPTQSQSPAQPRQANEQAVKRFKALVEREPEAQEPKTAGLEAQAPTKRRTDLFEAGGNPFGEKARPMAAASAPEAPVPASSSDAADRIAELEKASELALGLHRAHARPTATQLLLNGETAIAGGTIAQGAASGELDIAIHPGLQFPTADSLDALRRRLVGKGLMIGQLRLAETNEETGEAWAI